MAELLKFYQSKPNLKFLKKAADTLEQGGLIIYPTDTVYALGCLSNNIDGLQRLANIKKIKLDKAPFSFFMRDFFD
ncbi:MAG: L-threonylcarbamoyladenylate synthase [Flavobacteriaceae bacterium]